VLANTGGCGKEMAELPGWLSCLLALSYPLGTPYLLVFPQPRPGGGLRAIPTTSAPSHFRYTLRHEAETCLFLMEIGPQDFSVNAIDPFQVFNGHD